MTCESLTEVCRRKTAYSGAALRRDLRKETETKSLWPSGAFILPWGSVTILMLVSWVIGKARPAHLWPLPGRIATITYKHESPSLLIVVGIKHHNQKQLGEERVHFSVQLVGLQGGQSGQELGAGTWRQALMHRLRKDAAY